MNLYTVITLVILLSIYPIYKLNCKEIKTSKISVIVWGIITTIVNTLIIVKGFNMNNYMIHTIVLSIIALFFNYFLVNGDIEIKKVPKSFGVFLLFFFSVFFQFIPVILFNYDVNSLTYDQQMVLTSFSDIISAILLIIIYFKDLKVDFSKLKNKFYDIMDTGLKYWILGLIVMAVSNTIINILFQDATAVNEEGVQELIHSSKYLSVIIFGLFAPIVEELTFRKAFRDIFKNDLAFVLVSGITFGALHVVLSFNNISDLLYIIPYSSLGIAFAKAYQKTDNIYTSIIMHMVHNTVLTLFSIISLGVIFLW